jgi:hypothetical protein
MAAGMTQNLQDDVGLPVVNVHLRNVKDWIKSPGVWLCGGGASPLPVQGRIRLRKSLCQMAARPPIQMAMP